MMAFSHTIHVATPSAAYEVYVGIDVLDELGKLLKKQKPSCTKAVIISDSNVRPLYAATASKSLQAAGITAFEIEFAAGEANKRLSTLESILEEMATAELSRTDCVVALGGGVCGDMAGLAASLYMRGISVVQVPTSLLAMVDSSVGGKTAVDLGAGKNLVGTFKQPEFVLADVRTLETLEPELLADSMGEVIKHAAIADSKMFEQISKTNVLQAPLDLELLAELVAKNVDIKRCVVEQDETESSYRQVLNFGHSFGHAIEAASNFEQGHGACVCIGMATMTRAGEQMGWTQAGTSERLEACITSYGLPTSCDVDTNSILEFAAHDKKRSQDFMSIATLKSIGSVELKQLTFDEFAQLFELGKAGVSKR